jgi:hypothetical protein
MFDDWIEQRMRGLGFTEQREISRRDTAHVKGRTFRIIETWDRLTHTNPRRYAFALNWGSLLALHMPIGDLNRAALDWDVMLRSITFRDH